MYTYNKRIYATFSQQPLELVSTIPVQNEEAASWSLN